MNKDSLLTIAFVALIVFMVVMWQIYLEAK